MMNNTKRAGKKWILIVSVLLIMTVFFGCGSEKQQSGSAEDETSSKLEYSGFDELAGERIGVVPVYADRVKELIPTAELLFYDGSANMNQALRSHKIAAYTEDESIIKVMAEGDDEISWIPDHIETANIACAFPMDEKGEKLRFEVNEFVLKLKENGTLDSMMEIWTGGNEDLKVPPDYENLPAVNGTLRVAVDALSVPMVYIKDNRYAGFEIDLLTRFCKEKGCAIEFDDMTFTAVLSAIQSGKYDIGAASLTITEERAKAILFADPYFQSGVVLVVRTKDAVADKGFFEAVAESFRKTFIDEDRYLMFIQGIVVTLIISILSILFGTALGFGLYLLCRKGNRIANAVTNTAVKIVQGMPILILLMILYYIIFGKTDISGVVVAVIGFTISFGFSVYGMLVSGVLAVDKGQTECSYTLGLTDRQTFFGIILPQAMPHIIPSYKGEIVSLVKGTSIVGYLAVQDLTKVGDIIRSRTYEAFFPIIVVAVLYFILAALINFLIGRIIDRVNPRTRSRENFLKGVKTRD